MTKKTLKFLMEMIFIFILPLLFILPCIKIKDNFVYDNEGNFQVSERVVEFESPLNLTTHVIETRYVLSGINYHQVSVDDIQYEDWIYLNSFQGTNDNSYSLEDYDLNSYELLYNIFGSLPFSPEDYGISSNYIYIDNAGWTIFACTYEYFENEFVYGGNYSIDNIAYFFVLDFSYDNYQVITEEEELNLFGQIKKLIIDNLHIESSFLVDLLITYVFLWFVMFIIWHLFYLLLDFLLHFWRKEDK